MEDTMDMMDSLQTEDELDSTNKFTEKLVKTTVLEVKHYSDISAQWRQHGRTKR